MALVPQCLEIPRLPVHRIEARTQVFSGRPGSGPTFYEKVWER